MSKFRDLLVADRSRAEPWDEFSNLKPDLTPEKLAELRVSAREWDTSAGAHLGMEQPDKYTCDGCDAAPRCVFVFDAYNTNDGCLAEK